jgi:RND family efflux transporter MFP subunit
MKRIIGIVILLGIFAIIGLQLRTNKKISENRIYKYDKEAPIYVHAEKVKRKNITTSKTFTGTFEPLNEVKVNADVQGNIVKMFIKEGDYLKKGQPILKIDDQMLHLKLKAINAKIKGLEQDVKRYTKLTDEDAIPAIKLEKTLIALEGAKAEQSVLKEQISKTTVKAPFNGIVTKQFCEVGSFALPAKPLIEISNLNQLKFRINVTENDIDLFNAKNYPIIADIFPNDTLNGELLYTSSKGNMGNSFTVEFTLDINSSKKLKSKMFGSVIIYNENSNDLLIPAKCIVGSDVKPKVYLIKNGKAVLTPIVISSRDGDYVSVKSKINVGDIVVTGGFINLFENANVKIVQTK